MKAEIIALRHQVSVLQRTQKTKRLRLNPADRWLWVCLSGIWSGWRAALISSSQKLSSVGTGKHFFGTGLGRSVTVSPADLESRRRHAI